MKDRGGQRYADEKKLHHPEAVARIVDFSNGVMGFAITLLVVGIDIPHVRGSDAALRAELLALWPQFIAYIVSFYVIGYNWIIYNRIFSHIERVSERLYLLDLLYLFFIAVMPFTTSLVSMYPDRKLPVLIYAGAIFCVSLFRTLIWWYATSGNRLVHEDLDPRFVRGTLLRNMVILAGFVASAAIAFFSPIEAVYLWLLLAVFGLATRLRLYRQP